MSGTTDPFVVPDFDEFRIYDEAVQGHFNTITIDSKTVPLIIGTTQRAYASVSDLYNVTDYKRIPIPVGNMLRFNTQRDPSRFLGTGKMKSKRIVAEGPDGDRLTDKVLKTIRPYPVNLFYTLQYRTQTEAQANILQKKLILKTADERFIVSAAIPGFSQSFNFFASASEIIKSDETDVGENRDKRHVLSLSLRYEVYLFYEFSLHTISDGFDTTWTVVDSNEDL